MILYGGEAMSKEKEKIILPKKLQTEMIKFFFDVAIRRKKQEQLEIRLSNANDRSEE